VGTPAGGDPTRAGRTSKERAAVTLVRRNIWTLGTPSNPWHPTVLAYARAIAAMQALPIDRPTGWAYQAAIHGQASGGTPPPGAPWNECQHATWYFLPWHRMYLFHFEQIVRTFVAQQDGPDDWALPYWDYSSGAPGNALPVAFRVPSLPDGTANPLFVNARRKSVNAGTALPSVVTSTSSALAKRTFVSASSPGTTGFGGPRTGWAHQGPAFGELEAQPHGPVHVQVGGAGGLMTDPDTAALDPIFWLHHANIDRLWEVWMRRASTNTNPTTSAWLDQRFSLRDSGGASVTMRPRDVLDTVGRLNYTYDTLPAPRPPSRGEATPAVPRSQPVMIGRNDQPVVLGRAGATTELQLGALPDAIVAADDEPGPRVHLDVADIEGSRNPGIVYAVYLNLPDRAAEQDRDAHLAGVLSFFGIEQANATPSRGAAGDGHGMRYSFDVTDLVDRLRALPDWDPAHLQVTVVPVDDSDTPDEAGASRAEPLRIGTFSLHVD
jgi:tyrosinase